MKTFRICLAKRYGDNSLHFERLEIQAKSKAEANRIGKMMHHPEDKVFYRADLIEEIKQK